MLFYEQIKSIYFKIAIHSITSFGLLFHIIVVTNVQLSLKVNE